MTPALSPADKARRMQPNQRHHYFAGSMWPSEHNHKRDLRDGCYESSGGNTLDECRENSRYCAEHYGYNCCVEIHDASGTVVEEWTYWRHGPGEPVWLPGRIITRADAERAMSA